MDQFALIHFAITKNDRVYYLLVQPGSPFSDAESVCAEFAAEIAKIRIEAEAREASKDVVAAEQAEPAAVVEPEVLN